MRPAEIAEALRREAAPLLDPDRGIDRGPGTLSSQHIGTRIEMLAVHVEALGASGPHPSGDPATWLSLPAVKVRGQEPDMELSLLAGVATMVERGDIDRITVCRMAVWLMERYGESDA